MERKFTSRQCGNESRRSILSLYCPNRTASVNAMRASFRGDSFEAKLWLSADKLRNRMLSNSLPSIQSLLTDEFLLSEKRSHSIFFDSVESCRSVLVEKLANRCSVRCPVLMSHRIAALRPVSKRAGGDVAPYQIRSASNQHRLIAPHLASKEL